MGRVSYCWARPVQSNKVQLQDALRTEAFSGHVYTLLIKGVLVVVTSFFILEAANSPCARSAVPVIVFHGKSFGSHATVYHETNTPPLFRLNLHFDHVTSCAS
jgi:hypothetical protein